GGCAARRIQWRRAWLLRTESGGRISHVGPRCHRLAVDLPHGESSAHAADLNTTASLPTRRGRSRRGVNGLQTNAAALPRPPLSPTARGRRWRAPTFCSSTQARRTFARTDRLRRIRTQPGSSPRARQKTRRYASAPRAHRGRRSGTARVRPLPVVENPVVAWPRP